MTNPGSDSTAATGSARQHRVLLLLIAIIAAVIGLYLWALPAAAGLLALRIPVEWERQLGDAVADELAPADDVCDDPLLTQSVESIVSKLSASLPNSPYEYRVSVVDDTLVNAFAAPGGRLVVMRGLVQHTDMPEELAGVLSHEMQHVERRHGTRAILRQLPVGAILGVVGGGGGGAAVVGTLGALRYARGDESEADIEGMRLLIAADVDPKGMLDFFEKLEAITGPTPGALTYFSTHPATDDRRARLAELAESASASDALETPEAWSAIRTRCRANPEPEA